MQKALTTLGIDNIEAVVCNNDAMALGVASSLQEIGYNKKGENYGKFIPIVGIDGIESARTAIKNKEILGTVYQDAKTMSDVIIGIATALSNEKTPPKEINGVEVNEKSYLVPYKVLEQ